MQNYLVQYRFEDLYNDNSGIGCMVIEDVGDELNAAAKAQFLSGQDVKLEIIAVEPIP